MSTGLQEICLLFWKTKGGPTLQRVIRLEQFVNAQLSWATLL